MDNKQKFLIGLAVAGVAAYFITKPKYSNADAAKQPSKFWNRQAHLNFWKKLFSF